MFNRKIFTELIVIFLFTVSTVNAQNWDSTYRPGRYDIQVEHFKSFPDSKKDIIFLGNSITAHIDWSELLNNRHAKNRGISGDITFGVLERLNEVTEGQPAKVFILIGINDISRNIPDSLIVRNIRWMVQRIKTASPRTKIYLQTILPVNNEYTQFKNHYNKDEHISYVNSEMKKIAAEEKVILVDIHSHFLNADNKLEKNYTFDGLHLSAKGYEVWKKVLIEGRYLK